MQKFVLFSIDHHVNSSAWVILKKSPKLTVLKYWNKKLFLLKYFAGDH